MKDGREKKGNVSAICTSVKKKLREVTQKLLRLILSREWVEMDEKNKMVTTR